MQTDRLDLSKVRELVKEFYEHKMIEDEDVESFDDSQVTQELVDEMNSDIKASVEVNVPYVIWDPLADEGIVPEEWCDEFIEWYEQVCA